MTGPYVPTIPAPADPSPRVNEPRSPTSSWTALRDGNRRFVDDTPAHPRQGAKRRDELAPSQHPHSVVFGCSDSRVPAEIVFDQGLGDVFVVRNAGHVLDPSVLGTIEYGTVILGASLVVVLGHESCGAIAATAHTLATGEEAPGFVRTVVDRVMPSVARITAAARKRGEPEENLYNESLLRTEHVRHTVKMLHSYSVALRDRIADGSMAIVGTEYDLSTGRVHLVQVIGNVGDTVEHG